MFTAFQNLFPFVYSDTGSYIRSGFDGWVPFDRTIFYGLFLKHISVGEYPWFIIVTQAIIISYLIYKLVGVFVTATKRDFLFLFIITIITLFTGYSYNVGILLPDIFSAASLLCFTLLLADKNLHIIEYVIISIIFVFSICAHLSNLPVHLLMIAVLLMIYFIRRWKSKHNFIELKKLLFISALVIFSWILVPTVHYSFDHKFKTSKGSHAFIINHFNEIGVLDDFLERECKNSSYQLCQYKEEVGLNFLWDYENSPLYKMGGWEATEQEYKTIIKNIILSPHYWPDLIIRGTEYTFIQFFTYNTTVASPLLDGSAPFGQILHNYPAYFYDYVLSMQNRNRIDLSLHNQLQHFFVLGSLFILIVALLFSKIRALLNDSLVFTISLTLLFSLINAMVCSNLSTIDPRFQNRVVWLFVIIATVVIAKLIKQRNRLKELI